MTGIVADTDNAMGTAFMRSADGGATWVEKTQIFEMKIPGAKAETYDATHFRSPDEFMEYGKGLMDMDEFSIRMQFSTLDALDDFYADLKSKDLGNYGFHFPDDANYPAGPPTAILAAHVIGVDPETPMKERQVATITFRPSGKAGWV